MDNVMVQELVDRCVEQLVESGLDVGVFVWRYTPETNFIRSFAFEGDSSDADNIDGVYLTADDALRLCWTSCIFDKGSGWWSDSPDSDTPADLMSLACQLSDDNWNVLIVASTAGSAAAGWEYSHVRIRDDAGAGVTATHALMDAKRELLIAWHNATHSSTIEFIDAE